MSAGHLRFDGVWKSYPRWSAGPRTLRGMLARRAPVLARRGERLWALRDISFAVEPGEAVGVIGLNGAGKSTLLRLASGLGRPTRGNIALPAETASVLSLGESFDLSLTGRENAITAAIVAGLRRAEARATLPGVLEFAELEAFADAPVRTYSEGMKLRLAFSVVAQLNPDALVVDEVLAVGDARFQVKCLERIREMRESGTTLLLASHALDHVAAECDRALWLQGGELRGFGDAAAVVAEYRDAVRAESFERTPAPEASEDSNLELRRNRFGSQEITISRVTLGDPSGSPTVEIPTGAPLSITVEIDPRDGRFLDPIVGVAIHRFQDGVTCFDTSTESGGLTLGRVERRTEVVLAIERLDLLPNEYALDVGVYEASWRYAYDFHWQAYRFTVVGRGGDKGVFRPPHRWAVHPSALSGV